MLYDGKYTFIQELGSGGFGRVFLAQEAVSGLNVAIKQLNESDPARQQSIVHEIQMVAQLSHRNLHVVAYFHHFVQDKALFLVMEYCAGGSLRQRLQAKDYHPAKALNWIITLTDTLAWVHQQGVVHNDIKPDNLMLTQDGTLKLSDFGMANLPGGTRAYLPPDWINDQGKEPRVDVYSAGVTMLELLSGRNPFMLHSPAQIGELLDQGKLPVQTLPIWQQEIVFKATQRDTDLRFQTMTDFADALRAQHVPLIIDQQALEAATIARRAEASLAKKKWKDVEGLIEHADEQFPTNVPLLKLSGRYYLYRNRPQQARSYFEKALRLNARLDVQKELGWINMEEGQYAAAISLLSDHLHRNPGDYEAYNLLLRAYLETGRYETAVELGSVLVRQTSDCPYFVNNYLVSLALCHPKRKLTATDIHYRADNPFVDYNLALLNEKVPSHGSDQRATLKSKLLFQDFRFGKSSKSNLYLSIDGDVSVNESCLDKAIITIGRSGYKQNDICLSGHNVSRRHCLIVNIKDDVWVYNLDSTGLYMDGKRIMKRMPLTGKHILGIDEYQLEINVDKRRLL